MVNGAGAAGVAITEDKEIKGDELPQFVLDMISEGGIKAYYINQNS